MERTCSYRQYDLYEKQKRNLIYDGWHVVAVIRELPDEKAIEMAEPRDPEYVLTEAGRRML